MFPTVLSKNVRYEFNIIGFLCFADVVSTRLILQYSEQLTCRHYYIDQNDGIARKLVRKARVPTADELGCGQLIEHPSNLSETGHEDEIQNNDIKSIC